MTAVYTNLGKLLLEVAYLNTACVIIERGGGASGPVLQLVTQLFPYPLQLGLVPLRHTPLHHRAKVVFKEILRTDKNKLLTSLI